MRFDFLFELLRKGLIGNPAANLGAGWWPPVGRVDNVYGDRNLFCTCIPVDAASGD